MNVFLARLPGDTRPLPADPRLHELPTVLPLGQPALWEDVVATGQLADVEPWIRVGTVAEVRAVAALGGSLWLTGLEAGGPCGEVSTLILIRAAKATGRPFVVAGVGRRGMAAALAVGAHGVQVDVHTWLLDDSPLDEAVRTGLTRRSARDTTVLDGFRGLPAHPELPVSCAIGDARPGASLAAWWTAFADDLQARVEAARTVHPLHSDPFGTGTPIVQGPMANVSERPGLAAAVRDAGGLPFCALGALRPHQAEAVLEGMRAVQEPWGAGVIGFDVMPHRDAHLAAVRASGPRSVVLAGGSPALAVELQEQGLDPWLHTPSGRLAGMALRRGVRAVIFEGNEAGGHVGRLASTALWEEGLAAVEDRSPGLVVLAGGIGDAVSAAFAGAMAAVAHGRGWRVGLQVGTAWFATHEAVEGGNITASYQQRALNAERTVLVGATVDLPLRCVPNAYTDDAIAAEHQMRADGLALRERRERVEHHNLGRTRIAAKGIVRDGEGGYRPIPTARQLADGAFTVGEGALVTSGLTTVVELMHTLTVEASRVLAPRDESRGAWGAPTRVRPPALARIRRTTARAQTDADAPIAIVGLGCVLPGAPDVASFWRNVRFGMDHVRAVPRERWPHDRYFHPDPAHRRTTSYVRMAGVIDGFTFDSTPFGIPPNVVPSMDRAQQLVLVAAAEALRGLSIPDRSRAAVFLGNSMGGEHAKSLAVRVRFREVLAALGRDGDVALEDAVDAFLGARLPPVDVESMAGLLSNVIAGRVASWLDLGGGNATVDAACAASLGAMTMAMDALRAGRCDLVVTGGVDADLSPETFVGFCRTHALSPTGSQPFSTRADGFVMGEGAAVFVLERLDDALRHGHRVHAVLRGAGMASDGRSSGITAPRADGQALALRRALARADIDPATIRYVEAHGTGTSLGDRTELSALAEVYPHGPAIGSVKAQIGHLKGGAGAAGILKAVLAVREGVVPPAVHAGPLRAEARPFRVPRVAGPFPGDVRRAAVSAFGFGGTDYHVVLESPPDATPVAPPAADVPDWDDAAPLVEVFAADDRATLVQRVRTGQTCTPEEAASRAVRAVRVGDAPGLAAWIEGGGEGAFARSAWVHAGPAMPGVAVFPGQGSKRDGAAAVLGRIPASRAVLDDLDAHDPDTGADPAAQHHLLVALGAAYGALLGTMPLAGVVGHSVGELSALCCAGALSPRAALSLADARGAALHACPPGAMVAVSGDVDVPDGLFVAARNSPGARVLAGPVAEVSRSTERLAASGVRCTVLDVERAFHTPAVQPAADALAATLAHTPLAPGLPWWSNVPDADPTTEAGAKDALVRAVTAPVGFQDAIEAAAEAGHRLFVHAGPGAALARHIRRTVPDATVVCLHPDHEVHGRDLVLAAAELVALGHPGLLRALPGTFVQVAFPREIPVRPVPDGTLPEVPVAAPTPEAPAAPEPEEVPVATGSTRDLVVQAISEVTGYPRAAITSGAQLDTDLGIDSIRKMEIVGRIQELRDAPIDERRLATLESLDVDALVDFLDAEDTAPAFVPPAGLWSTTYRPALPGHGPPPVGIDPPDATAPTAAALTDWIRRMRTSAALAGPCSIVVAADSPAQRGAAAWLGVAVAEAGGTLRTVVDHTGEPVDARWLRGEGVVHARPDGVFEAVAASWSGSADLPDAPVVLASGGTTGILSRCLAALPGARGVVLGRRPDQTPPEGFRYVQADVTDPLAVAAAASTCRADHGRIDLVVHAAGVLRDGPAADTTDIDVAAVLDVKLRGAAHLIAATRDDAPVWLPFSSVSATLVNPGQAVYAAANAALEALVHPTASRSVPIAWSAWSDVGMAADPVLQRLLASRGIHALSPTDGARLFAAAWSGSARAWAARQPWPTAAGWSSPGPDSSLVLSPDAPFLRDHQVAGRPLVPAATWIGAGLAHGPLATVRITAPTPVDRVRHARIHAGGVDVDGSPVATWRVTDALPSPRPAPDLPLAPAAPHYRPDRLFHGPSWQVLDEVGFDAACALGTVDVEGPTTAQLVDAVHQLLALWALENVGWLGLPTGAACWASRSTVPAGRYVIALHAHVDGRTAHADATVRPLAGEPVLIATDVTVQAAR
jgi:3-oxoacyl-(acyl-carrier-protein) synthase/NAD(P)H-dependent flavin oxidoreductase YrpB (nitropropane dioxygenase family)/malonyl CoA-acyl carrier protein transacylase